MVKDDVYDAFEDVIRRSTGAVNPWHLADGERSYEPDYDLLETLLDIPVKAGSASATGRFASAIDAWVSHELRRAGFPPDEVWPRLTKPRVLPREVGLLINSLPEKLRGEVEAHLLRTPSVAPRDAKILGRAFVKQVDVLISQWARGPELMVSTKSMVSSFGNNLKNRFEESYGDAKNLRARYPMAAIGFLFVFRSTLLKQPGLFEAAIDMLRKLRAEADVYDSTCMIIADWDDATSVRDQNDEPPMGVKILNDLTPPDLHADQFLTTMIETVLNRTPIEAHVEVRGRREHRSLPVADLDHETEI